jgi:hypothetical protein
MGTLAYLCITVKSELLEEMWCRAIEDNLIETHTEHIPIWIILCSDTPSYSKMSMDSSEKETQKSPQIHGNGRTSTLMEE